MYDIQWCLLMTRLLPFSFVCAFEYSVFSMICRRYMLYHIQEKYKQMVFSGKNKESNLKTNYLIYCYIVGMFIYLPFESVLFDVENNLMRHRRIFCILVSDIYRASLQYVLFVCVIWYNLVLKTFRYNLDAVKWKKEVAVT